ncbi:hypothetical protein TNIN_248951 [Trichonephila inaurata madagascariensis]|uniref:Uncharacterized protein n=1 Tax=Trichonephila inaurata madagascariensis TaxID=2747483 RepID=A0A8X7BYP1_9ARAC|nr:hypothetical protein TNIN_248951 [Trichonephila inaurata madagascariensis]
MFPAWSSEDSGLQTLLSLAYPPLCVPFEIRLEATEAERFLSHVQVRIEGGVANKRVEGHSNTLRTEDVNGRFMDCLNANFSS